MNKLFSAFEKKPASKGRKPIIIVSGLPRSGTSMMMKILAEGGLPVVSDQFRTADDDNPNGYFELEAVKQMSKGNVEWLADAGGKGVKVISALLEYLPPDYPYKIIFMERDIQEVLVSQKKMLEHRQETPKLNDKEMEEQLRKHLAAVKPWLARQPNMDVLTINYNALMDSPEAYCRKIVDFLELPLNESSMLSVPNEKLYRNRMASEQK